MKFIYSLEDFSKCIIILKVLQDFGAAVLDIVAQLSVLSAGQEQFPPQTGPGQLQKNLSDVQEFDHVIDCFQRCTEREWGMGCHLFLVQP